MFSLRIGKQGKIIQLVQDDVSLLQVFNIKRI